jgi:hypothetical protein|tara:strand:- start:3273 stop:3542 length:270 start_codon:yes stop_codon:yes gene_type:complete
VNQLNAVDCPLLQLVIFYGKQLVLPLQELCLILFGANAFQVDVGSLLMFRSKAIMGKIAPSRPGFLSSEFVAECAPKESKALSTDRLSD